MVESNCDVLGINFLAKYSDNVVKKKHNYVCPYFQASPWYKGILYVLQNLQDPPKLNQVHARAVKLKDLKFFILNNYLYWKDLGGVLLNCLLEDGVKAKIQEFHEEDCGGHIYQKVIAHKILREGFCWPTLFLYVYKDVSTCHQCQIFEGSFF